MHAQTLTKSQAIAYAQQLYQVEILSVKGKQELIKRIEAGDLERPSIQADSIVIKQGVSVSKLLFFCSQAFDNELHYRSGIALSMEMANQIQKKTGNQPGKEIYVEKLSKVYEQRWLASEAYQIEQRIATEDTLPETANGWTVYPPLQPQTKDHGYIHSKRSALGKTITRTLNDLRRIGLIDEKIHRDVLTEIRAGNAYLEMLVVGFAAQRAAYYEDFADNRAKEIAFLQHLKEKQVLSEANYRKLVASYQAYELKKKFDFLPYCNQAKVFDLATYPLEPAQYYEQIFKQVKQILPDFNYRNLTIELQSQQGQDTEFIEQNVSISFEVDGRKYRNHFYHNSVRKVPQSDDRPDSLPRISTHFHKGINKWLADKNSPQRLYYANKFEAGSAYSSHMFGLIQLTEEQFKAWGTYHSDYFLSKQSHDNTFNSDNIQRIAAEYERIGLFSHLTAAEKDQARIKLEESEIDSYQSILLCYPKTIVYFDWETGNLENPYQALTSRFSEASRGAFMPTKIKDTFQKDWKKKKTRYGFEWKGKQYEVELKMSSDWLDPKFIELIEKAMTENQLDGKMYYCLDDGQAAGYIFLTKAQHQYLKAKQPALFPDSTGKEFKF
jgi:hypothetical protein